VLRESGQAVVEWVGTVLLIALLLAGGFAAAAHVDGRSLGGLLAHRLVCAVGGACDDGDIALEKAYGPGDAALVRKYLPGLVYEPGEHEVPVDWRQCRAVACATAPDDNTLDVHRTKAGHPVTVFTRLLRREDRRYLQYWFYYPDSNTAFAGSDQIWKQSQLLRLGGLVVRGSTGYPGYHRDDWEAASVRVDGQGEHVRARVTSHGHWQWCKWSACKGRWGPFDGWARVSRGSHSGHLPATAHRELGWSLVRPTEFELALPGVDMRERTTTPEGIRLVPLETLDRGSYRRLDGDISPPWDKGAYRDPETPHS
jgi:hypothetical protein